MRKRYKRNENYTKRHAALNIKRRKKHKENMLAIKEDLTKKEQQKYNPEIHPQLLVKIYAEGEGQPAFCAAADITIGTFYFWLDAHAEFNIAYEKAKMVGATQWDRKALQDMKAGTFDYKYHSLVHRTRYNTLGYLVNNGNVEKTIDEKLDTSWKSIKAGSLSPAEYNSLTNGIMNELKTKELELKQKELEIKQKELELEKAAKHSLSGMSDEFILKVMALKEGKADIVFKVNQNENTLIHVEKKEIQDAEHS